MRVDKTITIQRRIPNGSKESYHQSDGIATAMYGAAGSDLSMLEWLCSELMEAEVS